MTIQGLFISLNNYSIVLGLRLGEIRDQSNESQALQTDLDKMKSVIKELTDRNSKNLEVES